MNRLIAVALLFAFSFAALCGEDPMPVEARVAPTENEKVLQDVFATAFPMGENPGRMALAGRKAVPLGVRQAVLAGLLKNLNIARAENSESLAKLAREEARALFDPVLSASITHTHSVTFDRTRIGRVHKRATVRDAAGNNVLLFTPEAQEQTRIESLFFLNPRPDSFEREFVDASREQESASPISQDVSISLDQRLPWGASISFTYATARRETFTEIGDEFGQPWTSNLSGTLFIPIPLTAGFGPYGAEADVTLRQANYTRDRAFWDTKTIINSTLLVIDNAYWDLAGAAENLRASIENRRTLESVLEQQNKLLEAGRSTEDNKQQIVAELSGVREIEEAAWGTLLQASNNLAALIDQDKDAVLLPSGYTENLNRVLPLNLTDSYAIAAEFRPELRAEEISKRASEVLVKFAQNLTKPNLTFNASLDHQQLGFLFGYQDWWDTITQLPNQDARISNFGLTYTRPVQNRAVKGAHKATKAQNAQQAVTIELTRNLVEKQVGDALILLHSRKRQMELAKESLKEAREALRLAKEFFEAGRLTEFEIINRNRDVLIADFSVIATSVEFKKAEALLLSAEGVLPYFYAAMTAEGSIERRRIGALEQSRMLQFFGGEGAAEKALEQPKAPEAPPADPQP